LTERRTSSDHSNQRPPDRPSDGTTKLFEELKRELTCEELYLDVPISETKVICALVDLINLARYSILVELSRSLPIPRQFQPTSFIVSLEKMCPVEAQSPGRKMLEKLMVQHSSTSIWRTCSGPC
jgi:hypothetical protein